MDWAIFFLLVFLLPTFILVGVIHFVLIKFEKELSNYE